MMKKLANSFSSWSFKNSYQFSIIRVSTACKFVDLLIGGCKNLRIFAFAPDATGAFPILTNEYQGKL